MDLKPATTHAQQLAILESRGLIIENRDLALETLKNVNYYVLSGYLHGFKKEDGSYQEGLSFERIYMLYKFDCHLRNILLYAIENVEQSLKTKIACAIALHYPENPCQYESEDSFENKDDHKRFMDSFCLSVCNNASMPFVAHHIEKYDNHFPIWVAVELFTWGNIQYLYKNIPDTLRRAISRDLGLYPYILDSWIGNLRRTRNAIAHNTRLYDMVFRFSPKLSAKRHKYRQVTYRVFDQIYLIKLLYFGMDDWENIVGDIKTTLERYSAYVSPSAVGFPENWESILLEK